MYIPTFYPTRNTTIINKHIVYSDTVLPLKELGNNIKVTKISNISESSLQNCLQIIFDSNKDVTFNTIQYSKNNNELYFYTDKQITTEEWKKSKLRTYSPLTKTSEILEEIKNIFISEPNRDTNCISLYEVSKLLKKKNNEFDKTKDTSEDKMKKIIRKKYGDSSNIIIYGFDYEKNELEIGFKYINEYQQIIFSKEQNDLYIKKSETYRDKEILTILGTLLSELYDEFIKFKDYKQQKLLNITSINSNFLINIDQYGTSIYILNNKNKYMRDFELSSKSYTEEYQYNCNSNLIINIIKGKETEFLKRIYINIKDCPKWTQPILQETRKQELLMIEENEKKERKKQKRLELKRKIFPFIK